jgi:hypothetical protein
LDYHLCFLLHLLQPHGEKLKQLYGCVYEQSCELGYTPTGPVEQKYFVKGSWQVLEDTTDSVCDSFGNKCTLYYPNITDSYSKRPIVTWGNGTNSRPDQYAYFLKHLVSWGFVVIATQEQQTLLHGKGKAIFEAAQLLVRSNDDAGLLKGVFYKRLDVRQIGAAGHSQGAAAAIAALMQSNGLIKTVVPIELPSEFWCTANCIDIGQLKGGSIFFVTGSLDFIAPPTQWPSEPGLQSIEAYYKKVPNQVPKLMGALNGSGHADVLGQPGCQPTHWTCGVGVYGYLGYPTAWLMYQLQGDTLAHGAFVKGTGEIFLQRRNWPLVESNIR